MTSIDTNISNYNVSDLLSILIIEDCSKDNTDNIVTTGTDLFFKFWSDIDLQVNVPSRINPW